MCGVWVSVEARRAYLLEQEELQLFDVGVENPTKVLGKSSKHS